MLQLSVTHTPWRAGMMDLSFKRPTVPLIRRVQRQESGHVVITTTSGQDVLLTAQVIPRSQLRALCSSAWGPLADVVVVSGVVDPELRAALTDASVSFLDEAGNCNIGVAGTFFVSIEGRTLPDLPPAPKGMRSASYRALFALLVEPDLINASLRELAARAGVSTTSAAALRNTLRAEGSVATVKGKARLRLSDELVQRWLVGYRDVVRPWLFIGRYEAPPGGRATLAQILDGRFPDSWRWGGALADEALGGHLRDAHTTVHLNLWLRKEFPRVPLRPSQDGEITVLGVPGPLAMPEHRASVHPLLVHSELSIDPDPRSREAAAALLERLRITGDP